MGVAVVAVTLAGHLRGAEAGLPYLGPVAFAFVPLALGRYPGERMLLVLSRPVCRRARDPGPPTAACGRSRRCRAAACCSRSALAGRAPPASRRPL